MLNPPASNDASSRSGRKLRLLLAEDDDLDFFIFELAVQRSKCPVEMVWAKNGVEAIDYLKTKTDAFPDVIVTDIKMPMANGFELLAWIRVNPTTAKIPSVILSGSDVLQDRARAEEFGISGYHVKTGDIKGMTDVIVQIYEECCSSSQS